MDNIYTSLAELVRGTLPARAIFVGRYLGSVTVSSFSVGIACGYFGSMSSIGPIVPFLLGSWVGYTSAVISFWRQEVKSMMSCARQYPKLLERAILTEFGNWAPAVDRPMLDWLKIGGIRRITWAILAAQSCQSAIADIENAKLQDIIQEYKITPQCTCIDR